MALKHKYCQFDKIFITGCTRNSQNFTTFTTDWKLSFWHHLQCSLWQQFIQLLSFMHAEFDQFQQMLVVNSLIFSSTWNVRSLDLSQVPLGITKPLSHIPNLISSGGPQHKIASWFVKRPETMAANWQIFSNAYPWNIICQFSFKFHWNLLLASDWQLVSSLLAGLHKIETGLGTKFQDKFSAWFSRNFMLSGKSENVHFILSNYI